MRKKVLIRVLIIAAAVLFFGTAALFILRPDSRFAAGRVIDSFSGSAELKEINEAELELQDIKPEDAEKFSVSVDQSLMLVNNENTLKNDFVPEMSEYKKSGVQMNKCILSSYAELSKAVSEKFGEKLFVMSSYRTAEEQAEIETEQGSDTAMPAGSSEHQTGLALDVYLQGFAGEAIIKCEAGQFINTNCQDYGFIIRYPILKKNVTGIDYEPWHIRYVGSPHAEIISKEHETLEEYFDSLEYGKFYRYESYTISRQNGKTLKIPKGENRVISSDNCGGYIITVKTQ